MKYENTSPCLIEPPRTRDKRTGTVLLSGKGNNIYHDVLINSLKKCQYAKARSVLDYIIDSELAETCQDISVIIAFYEDKFKFVFERMHKRVDGSYQIFWHNTDKQQEKIKKNFLNTWYFEKVKPLLNELPAAAARHGVILEMLLQPSPGILSIWVSSQDGLKLYYRHQT